MEARLGNQEYNGDIEGHREHQDTMETPGYQRFDDVTETTQETLDFSSKDFRSIRVLLRLLSLWRPPTAGVFERYIYPVLINMLLVFLGPVRNGLRATRHSSWLSMQSMYIVHETVIWLGHIFGNYYFRSDDLTKVFPGQPLPGTTKRLQGKVKLLKWFAVISMVICTIMNCTLFIVVDNIHNGVMSFSSDTPHIHGVLDHVSYAANLFGVIYNLGIGLALSWTMCLLYVSYASRLKALEEIFLKWRETTNDAIYYFNLVYARPVKHSWKRISWWFLAHNLVALAIPLYGYQLAQALSGVDYQSKYLPQFICYLIFVLTIWITPIIMAEQIKRSEKEFQENVNNFCLDLLKTSDFKPPSLMTTNDARNTALTHTPGSGHVGTSGDTTDAYTFATRGKELKHFLKFLKNRKQGLVVRGYALQLNVSVISFFMGIVSFLIKFNG